MKKRAEMKKKRGLSTIIVTLIIILLSLVAIGILWNTVKYLLQRQTEITHIENSFFSEQIKIMSVKYDEPLLNITLRKPSGEIKATSVNITAAGTLPLEADIFSIVDLSGSMRQCYNITSRQCNNLGGSYNSQICDSLSVNAQDGCILYSGIWNDKLTATQNANKDLINNILHSENTRMGLVGYRSSVVISASTNLTTDVNLLNTTINSWQATSSTCICCGINNAVTKLIQQSSQEKLKSMIIMSDGEANFACTQQGTGNPKNDAIKAACDANSSLNNLIIYSIGVQGADQATLTSIANCGGGRYFSVTNTSELIGIYQGIAQQIEERYYSLTSLNYLLFIFYNATDSYKENIFNMPDVLQTKTYDFNLQGELSGRIIKIEVYPVAITSYKQEIIGPMLDSWKSKIIDD